MQKNQTQSFFREVAPHREFWKNKNRYYHDDIETFVLAHCFPYHRILEIGCGTGSLIGHLPCRSAVGIDFSEPMIRLAQQKFPSCSFIVGDTETLPLGNKDSFDRIVFCDTLGLLPDIQKAFDQIRQVSSSSTRVLVTSYNYLWEPILKIADFFTWRMPQPIQNWLPLEDIENLLYLSGFEVVKKGYRMLLPKRIPLLSTFVNQVLAKLPGLRRLCLVEYIIAKTVEKELDPSNITVSVIIPCRNERDNILPAVTRTPLLGMSTELIFVDGSSTDGTVEEIERMQRDYPGKKIRLVHQGGRTGKGDAVRKGFDAATGDILMILDADLTVPPENLPKFFHALIQGKGEFVNGSRMVYPMEKQAMRIFNLLGNKFFGLAFTYLLEQRFRDTLCGTKVLWKCDYERIKQGRSYFGEFDPFGDFDLIFGASRQDLKIVELPVCYKERTYGKTKIRRWFHGWLLLKMCWIAMKKLKFTS